MEKPPLAASLRRLLGSLFPAGDVDLHLSVSVTRILDTLVAEVLAYGRCIGRDCALATTIAYVKSV